MILIYGAECDNFWHNEARTMRPTFAENIFKCIFLKANVSILLKVSPELVFKGPNDIKLVLVGVLAWCLTP